MTADLLPCPFCGGSAERIDFGPGSGDNEGGSCIACTKCQSSGPVEFGYKENFVSNWNRRAGELCRAAPAGGDVEVVRLRQLLAGTQEQFRVVSELLERNQAHHERMMKLMDSAPAGSGEVEKQARELYVRWVDQQNMHCNRFPSWQELSAKDRQEWFDKVVAADTGNAEVDRVIGRLMSSDTTFDDCSEAADLLRKLQQGADGWMSIESAPKDGTEILMTNGEVVHEGHWFHDDGGTVEHRDLDGKWIGQDDSDGFDGWIDWGGGMIPAPTHWQPLPKAPASQDQEGGGHE